MVLKLENNYLDSTRYVFFDLISFEQSTVHHSRFLALKSLGVPSVNRPVSPDIVQFIQDKEQDIQDNESHKPFTCLLFRKVVLLVGSFFFPSPSSRIVQADVGNPPYG